MNKSLGFIVSMVIFAIGVFAVILSMILSGFDEITVPIAICQAVTILCMVGLLAIKLAKTEETEENGDFSDNRVYYEEESEPDYSDESDDYAEQEEPVYVRKASYPTQELEVETEPEIEPEPEVKAVPRVTFEDEASVEPEIEEHDSAEPEIEVEEEMEPPKSALFEMEQFEPDVSDHKITEHNFEIFEPSEEELPIADAPVEEVPVEKVEEPVHSEIIPPKAESIIEQMEPTFHAAPIEHKSFEEPEDEFSLDMDSIIEQVFMPEQEEFTYEEQRTRLRFQVVGVKRVRTRTPRPRRLFLRK